MEILRLRPHHINCIFFYEGKGYSDSFVDNMDQLVQHLKDSPQQQICFKVEKDVLCEACPHQRGTYCLTEAKVSLLDQKTLKVYGLEENKVYCFEAIQSQIYKGYKKEEFVAICKECEWYKQGVCIEEKIPIQEAKWQKINS